MLVLSSAAAAEGYWENVRNRCVLIILEENITYWLQPILFVVV
jgi:hypothetical protein